MSGLSRRRAVRVLVAGLAAGVAFSLVQVSPPPVGSQAEASDRAAPAVDTGDSVPVTKVTTPKDEWVDPARKAALRKAPAVEWPAAGRAVVEVPGAEASTAGRESSRFGKAGGLPVRVAAGDNSPTRVEVAWASRAKATKARAEGGLLRVSVVGADEQQKNEAQQGKTRAGSVRVRVDYSDYARAYGGDWSRRLRLVALPSCAWKRPGGKDCTDARPLPSSVNDRAAQTLTAMVDVSGGPVVLAAIASASGDTGDFSATKLSSSATWSAGGSSGGFSWSYPLRNPPGVGGPEPKLALTYSSQAVDGMTASTNNQPSVVGQGFELASSYVERKYASCYDDGHENKGDLCWKSDNATLVLNGQATELVKDADSGVWRLKEDDGSRIQRLTNPNGNGDGDREYWVLTTTDGTRYFFGRHRLPGWSSGEPDTWSVQYVPVVGDDAGEPCHDSSGFAASFCNQAWKWNLDYVVDPNGNAMSLFYEREVNYYAKNGDTSPGTGVYVRGGVLKRIEYGERAGSLGRSRTGTRVVRL